MNSNFRLDKNKTEDFHLRNLAEQVVIHWYWFVLSIIIALVTSWILIRVMPSAYKLSALIMVDSRPKMNGMTSETSTLLDPSILPDNNNNAEKTVQVLKSARLVRDVVKRLKLDRAYFQKEGFRRQELYTTSPITVELSGQNLPSATFLITPSGNNSCHISDVSVAGNDVSWKATTVLGSPIKTPMGNLVVRRSEEPESASFTGPVIVTCADADSVADAYREKMSIEVDDEKAEAVKISLIESNFHKTQDFINMLIAVYNEYALEDKNKAAENTANFIKDRVKLIGLELGDVDKEIEEFKQSNSLTDLKGESELYLTNQSQFSTGATAIATQVGIADHMISILSTPGSANEFLPPNSSDGDQSIAQLITSYNNALANRNKLQENSSGETQAVKDLNVALANSRNTLLASYRNLKYSLWMQLQASNKQKSRMAGMLNKLPEQERGLQTISRQQQVKQQLYLYLLQKREENALNLALTTSNIRVIDYAEGSHKPVSPNKLRILAMALALGLVVPTGVIYLWQQLNTRVRGKKDIETYTTIPIIGTIPQGDKSRSTEVGTQEPGKDALSEAFRIARSNLHFVLPAADQKVILITSTQSGEGKTFISFNLAISLAMANRRVILVNTDIRKKGNAPHSFTNGGSGLTHYLAGSETDWRQIIRKGELVPTLDIISSGAIPPNPAELLMSNRLDQLIETLKKEYDYVILDNVPMRQVADAAIVSRLVDLTIYVIREGVLDRRMLPEIQKFHQTARLKNMVVLLNGCRQASKWGYGYGYGYGYGN